MFVALKAGRPVEASQLPEESVISPITFAELHAGVLAARTIETRAVRLNTLQQAADVELVPIDERVAAAWALLRTRVGESGRRVDVNDLWIAATGLANRLPVYTQDGDFAPVQDVEGLEIVRV